MAAANVPVIQGIAGGTPIAVTAGAGASATGTITSVASTNADATILASNVNRKGGSIFNDDTNVLYLALSNVTSSATVYTLQVPPKGYFEIPFGYTAVVKGLWSATGAGAARVTEYV